MNIFILLLLFLSTTYALSTTTPTTKSHANIFHLSTALPSLPLTMPIMPSITTPSHPSSTSPLSLLDTARNRRGDGPPTVDSLEPLTTMTATPSAPIPSLSESIARPSVSTSHFGTPQPASTSTSTASENAGGDGESSSTTPSSSGPSSTSTAQSKTTSEKAKGSSTASPTSTRPTTSPSPARTPSIVSVLWQPSSSSAKRLSIPRFLMALISLQSIAAQAIIPRLHPSSYSLIPNTPLQTSYPASALAHYAPLCPAGQSHCGVHVCYDPKARWCCPSQLHVCALGESCAEGKSEEKDVVYGCAAGDTKNGTEPKVRTTSVNTETGVASTGTATGTATETETAAARTTSPSVSASASVSTSKSAEPTKSAGRRLGVPAFVGLLVRGAKVVGFPSPVRGECCWNICCKVGEVCARGTEGARCWPQAKRRDENMANEQDSKPVAEEFEILGEVTSEEVEDASDEDLLYDDTKGGGQRSSGRRGSGSRDSDRAAPAGGGAPGGGKKDDKKKKSGANRPTIPTLLYIFLFLFLFPSAFTRLLPTFNAAVHPRTIGTPQIDPDRLLIAKQSKPLYRRWSCHSPRQDCGSGCWDPAKHVCCVQVDEKTYGLCAANQGQSCCGAMCCPKDTFCQIQDGYTCVPKKMKQ